MKPITATAISAALFMAFGTAQARDTGNMQHQSSTSATTTTSSSAQARTGNNWNLQQWNQAELRNGVSAGRMIGMDVRGRNGDSLGEVENIIVSRDGRAQGIVISAGGVLGVGETYFRVPWNQAQFDGGMEHVTVPIAEDNVDTFKWNAEDVRVGGNELLVRDILDANASLRGGERYGDIDDVVIGRDGRVKGLIVTSRLMGFDGNRYAYPFRGNIAFDQSANRFLLPYDRAQIDNLRPFEYDSAGITGPSVGATGSASAGGSGGYFGTVNESGARR